MVSRNGDTVDVTRLLGRLTDGDREALDELFPAVYEELRQLAHYQRRGERSQTLDTTALVHEAYFKLVNYHDAGWQSRTHFFGVASRAMRQVLVDRARKRNAQKRGGDRAKVSLEEATIVGPRQDTVLLALDEALDRLEEIDERQSRVVELRFFAGLTVEEAAHVLGVSASTVKRDWRTAKAWLYRKMKE